MGRNALNSHASTSMSTERREAESGPDRLTSSRYAVIDHFDRFSRHRILVEEARRYSSVLECGCANGFLTRLIAADGGPRVVGVEYEAEGAEQAARFCQRVVVADLNREDWTEQVGETFDLVIFGDVLEHLLRPSETLHRAARLLKPGGRVLVSLPNIAHWTIRARLMAGNFDYQSAGILDTTHLRFFTVKSANEMIRQAGYRSIRFTPTFGGRFTTRLRPVWDRVTRAIPGLFALQMIFLLEPDEK